MKVAYIHGFLTSSMAKKSVQLNIELKKNWPKITFLAPDYPEQAQQAVEYLCNFYEQESKDDTLCLVGSSMGGFLATVLSHRYGCKAALINPCIHPQDYVKNYMGEQVNLITGERFVIDESVLEYLTATDASLAGYDPKLLTVYLQRGDEVLDYRKSERFYAPCTMSITDGGCHAFDGFKEIIAPIMEFFLQKE